jgi:peptidoglycan/LPS O-acetylase OafA/YrhL
VSIIKIREFPEIDFLRFLACLSVVIWHFTASLPFGTLSYGHLVQGVPWNLMWAGVNLFFIISGYVIAHTLLKSYNAKDFIIKRITRIYSALWLILPIVFLVQYFIPYSIFKNRSTLANLLGSMTLVPPSVLNIPNIVNFDWLTGVLWTLKVEMVFYLLCYVLFSFFPYKKIVFSLVLICTLTSILLIIVLNFNLNYANPIAVVLKGLGLDYLPWFVLGMLFYEQKVLKEYKHKLIVLFAAFALAISVSKLNFSLDQIAEFTALVLFIFVVFRKENSKLIKLKIVQVLGFSSYEMYLIHQGLGIPILIFLIEKFELTSTESFLLMIIILLLLFLVSSSISKVTLRLNLRLRRLSV